MYMLRKYTKYGEKLYAPENAPIINIQCGDPLIELLDHWINPDDACFDATSVADLLETVKRDLESEEAKERFLENDLKILFDALGMEN